MGRARLVRPKYSLAGILLAKIFPMVQLKSKVANKILKVLDKSCRSKEVTADTLSILLVVFRTQNSVVDKEKVISMLGKHEELLTCTGDAIPTPSVAKPFPANAGSDRLAGYVHRLLDSVCLRLNQSRP